MERDTGPSQEAVWGRAKLAVAGLSSIPCKEHCRSEGGYLKVRCEEGWILDSEHYIYPGQLKSLEQIPVLGSLASPPLQRLVTSPSLCSLFLCTLPPPAASHSPLTLTRAPLLSRIMKMMKVSNQLCSTMRKQVFRRIHHDLPSPSSMLTWQHLNRWTQPGSNGRVGSDWTLVRPVWSLSRLPLHSREGSR